MEQLSCPVQDPGRPLTLKVQATAFAEADMAGVLEPLRPTDEMSLEELKCEADSMMALAAWLITRGLGQSDAHQEVFARRLRETTPEGGNVLETLLRHEDEFIKTIVFNGFKELRENERSKSLFERLEHYRQAYYERSPQADDLERHYVSSENMLLTGVNTAADRFAVLLHAFNVAATGASLSKQQKVELARASDHLPVLLAKLAVADEARYVDILNEHDFLVVSLVKIDNTDEAGPRAIFDRRIITKMRQLYPVDKPEYDHRGHLGCPASVSFDGGESAISELWRMTVGALEKYGFWDDSEAHV